MMDHPTPWPVLLARVLASNGDEHADRLLDYDLFRAMDPDFAGWHRWALREAALYQDGWQEGRGRKKLGPILLRTRRDAALSLYRRYAADRTPCYMTSIDAALALVPEGWHAEICTRPDWPSVKLIKHSVPCDSTDFVTAATPPRALVAACIRATELIQWRRSRLHHRPSCTGPINPTTRKPSNGNREHDQ